MTNDKEQFISNKMEDLDGMGLPDECVSMVRDVVEELAESAETVDSVREELANALERIAELEAEIEKLKQPALCVGCGTADDLRWGPCPYASEINNNETEMWLCGECRHQRAQDI